MLIMLLICRHDSPGIRGRVDLALDEALDQVVQMPALYKDVVPMAFGGETEYRSSPPVDTAAELQLVSDGHYRERS